ncbi:ATP-binding protein [Metabacillus herbersteinensis]|uniref:histidine kinase n=1 Tax=Metabacillus herbersteinensis TaxID=283816 RepID=A0ABV6GBL5_9BACI
MWKFKKLRLQDRIAIFTVSLILFIVLLSSLFYYHTLSNTVEQQLGKRALHVATTVSLIPEIQEAFSAEEPSLIIQPIVEKMRKEIDAKYIVVGNIEGIRYSHPVPERLGQKMMGGDNNRALEYGESYVSKATGSLGPSMRGKVPIKAPGGEIIGVVSVGFSIDDINHRVAEYTKPLIWIALFAFLLGSFGSILLAKNIKRILFGLEPEEIITLYTERNAVIESVREGILVVNNQGKIVIANQAAYDILTLGAEKEVIGKHVLEIIPTTTMLEVLQTGEKQLDRQMVLRNKRIIANRLPVKNGEQVIGVVSSFRLKSDIEQLTEELSQVKRYTDALRAQTHEFNNLLYTISGLIQLGSNEEALSLIHEETVNHQDFVQFIMKKIKDPWLGGILIGFYNRAKELKIEFIFDRESSLEELPQHVDRSYFVSILGNLITNAFESTEKQVSTIKWVRLFITDLGNDVLIEVEDSGDGIEDGLLAVIFERGFSTKEGGNRGLGLSRVKELVTELEGSIAIEKGESNGALFIVAIPKETRGAKL